MARLQDHYCETIAPAIALRFGVTNKMAIPKLEKIVINMGVGRATQDKALMEAAVDSLTRIAGQKPLVTKAKTSVAGFRLREGNEIGCKVTLRGKRMYEFLDRLVSIALPRIRDFRGVNPNSFDGHGNYTLGLAEQVVFPEIDADRLQHTQGMDITIVTTAKSDLQARELLNGFGMPFRSKPPVKIHERIIPATKATQPFSFKDPTMPTREEFEAWREIHNERRIALILKKIHNGPLGTAELSELDRLEEEASLIEVYLENPVNIPSSSDPSSAKQDRLHQA